MTLQERRQAISWSCRFHPTEGFHEIGCGHCMWTNDQLLDALITKKEFEQAKLREWRGQSVGDSES